MQKISYRRHRFPSEIIQHAVWLYFRLPLSYRDVEDLLAERGIAEAIFYLVSDPSAHVTGQALVVDGGECLVGAGERPGS